MPALGGSGHLGFGVVQPASAGGSRGRWAGLRGAGPRGRRRPAKTTAKSGTRPWRMLASAEPMNCSAQVMSAKGMATLMTPRKASRARVAGAAGGGGRAANAESAAAGSAGALVVYTQDWHPPSTPHFAKDGGVWPVHCLAGSWGAALHPALDVGGPGG